MKRIITLLFLIISYCASFAQTTNPTPTKFTNGLGSDTYFNLPTQPSNPISTQIRVGSMYHNSVTGLYMRYNGTTWESIAMTKQIGDSLLIERARVNLLISQKETKLSSQYQISTSSNTVTIPELIGKTNFLINRSGAAWYTVSGTPNEINKNISFNSSNGQLGFENNLFVGEFIIVEYSGISGGSVPNQINSRTVNTYSDMLAFGTPINNIIYRVKVDENKGMQNTMYLYSTDGIILWVAATNN